MILKDLSDQKQNTIWFDSYYMFVLEPASSNISNLFVSYWGDGELLVWWSTEECLQIVASKTFICIIIIIWCL